MSNSLESSVSLKRVVTSRLTFVANDEWHLGLSDRKIAQFVQYAELLVEWNARFNLTRLITPEQIANGHFLDSLSILNALEIPVGDHIVDIGTGAGLPGIALKIARPDLAVTLIDSTAKKLAFCDAVVAALALNGIRTLHGRAEDVSKLPQHNHKYDVAVARALAPLERLLPWCTPFVKAGGLVIALKGSNVGAELKAARAAAGQMRITVAQPIAVDLLCGEPAGSRCIIAARRSPAGAAS